MISQARLKEILHYDPITGVWMRLCANGNSRITGRRRNQHGYHQITIDGRLYCTARLAVLYMTGKWPAHEVDHKHRQCGDDRWMQLRQATHSQNMCNRVAWGKTASKGVSYEHGRGYRARIQGDGQPKHLGWYPTEEEAAAAYADAAVKLHGEFSAFGGMGNGMSGGRVYKR